MDSEKVLHNWRKPVAAQSLALWSLSVASPHALATSRLIEQAAIMQIEPAAMRVALGRLVRERMASGVARGVYALGPAAAAIHAKARRWSSVEDDLRPWRGGWIVVLANHLGRTDRRQVQARERALRLVGLRADASGAWVRPDNLGRDAGAMGDELRALGLDRDALILVGCDIRAGDDEGFRKLWPVALIEDGYRHWLEELEASAARLSSMNLREGARETFLLGQSVIRAINSDPLLPAGMIDAGLRTQLIDAMKDYDVTGRRIWATLAPGIHGDASDTGMAA